MNPIILQTMKSNPMMSSVKQMMSALNNSQNPSAMLQQMIQNNPQMKQVMDIVQQAGGDPKAAFYNLAQQKGINPQDILDMLK